MPVFSDVSEITMHLQNWNAPAALLAIDRYFMAICHIYVVRANRIFQSYHADWLRCLQPGMTGPCLGLLQAEQALLL